VLQDVVVLVCCLVAEPNISRFFWYVNHFSENIFIFWLRNQFNCGIINLQIQEEGGFDLNKRIEEIRKYYELTRAAFGERLGVSGDVINNLERGRVEVKDHIFKLICKEFNVNETWLRTGEGEMFRPKTINEELVELTDKLLSEESTSFKNRLVSALARLSEEQWDLLEGIIDEISKKE
jgi:transcriptional regulator with XRE-family HTH domain